MKRVIRIVLPLALAFALALPGTAMAAAASAAGAEHQLIDPGKNATDRAERDGCKDGKCGERRKGIGMAREDAAFRVYALMTGKSEDQLRKTCEAKGLTIWKLAGQEGKLQALKDRLLAGHTAGLDEMVKSGVMTEQQREKIIAHMKEELDKKQ